MHREQSAVFDEATPALIPARQLLFCRRGFARSPGEREKRSPLVANPKRLDSSQRGAGISLPMDRTRKLLESSEGIETGSRAQGATKIRGGLPLRERVRVRGNAGPNEG